MVFNGEVCNNSFIIHLHRISGEKEGKEMRRKEKRREKSVAQTWLDLNLVPLGLASAGKPRKQCYLVYL